MLIERSLGEHPVDTFVEQEFRAYLRCGILSFGFARDRCGSCRHDFLVAFSCKGRGICPSCNGRRMAQTAAHLVDHVIPPVPVRQWVISVPKRLRYFLAERSEAVAALTRIFMREVERLVRRAAAAAASPADAADDMLTWEHSGFSIDASVRISLDDRDCEPDRVRYTLPRHKRGAWIGPGRTK